MISRFKALIKKAVGISTTDKVECAVDETKVDCSSLGEAEAFRNDALRHYEAYTGIPAPAYLEDDTWFAPPIHSQKQLDYMEQETHIKQQQYQETHTDSVESEDIHQKMYGLPLAINLQPFTSILLVVLRTISLVLVDGPLAQDTINTDDRRLALQ